MKLFNLVLLTLAAYSAAEEEKSFEKICKQELKKEHKNNPALLAEKVAKCVEKANRRQKKQDEREERKEAKQEKKDDRLTMKEEVRKYKKEKNDVKAQRTVCKNECEKLADPEVRTNCRSYWVTKSRNQIAEIMNKIAAEKERTTNASICLPESGITGEVTLCKDEALSQCEGLGYKKPSNEIRSCKNECNRQCLEGTTKCDYPTA